MIVSRKPWKVLTGSWRISFQQQELVMSSPITFICHRKKSTNNVSRSVGGKLNGKDGDPVEDLTDKKVTKDILKYFNEPNKKFVLKMFPGRLLKKKKIPLKTPEDLYLASKETARKIADVLKMNLPSETPLIEVNPGLGLITSYLIDETENNVLIFEPEVHFHSYLNSFITSDKTKVTRNISLKHHEINRIGRMVFRDQQDGGNRVEDALSDVKRADYEEDPYARFFHITTFYPFLLHIINATIYQSSLMAYGRCECFLVISPLLFAVLTSSNRDGYFLYRWSSILFQILFEYEFITKFNRKDFLPWPQKNSEKTIDRYRSLDPDMLYFIRAVPRRNLYRYCLPENLPALRYFIRQNFQSRKIRVIPKLEKWIPGCGKKLIMDEKSNKPPDVLFPEQQLNSLPEYIESCRELSNEDFFENISIYTEFGDLTPTQVLTLFNQFIKLPGYKESSFVASLDHYLMNTQHNPNEKFDTLDPTLQKEDEIEADEKFDVLDSTF